MNAINSFNPIKVNKGRKAAKETYAGTADPDTQFDIRFGRSDRRDSFTNTAVQASTIDGFTLISLTDWDGKIDMKMSIIPSGPDDKGAVVKVENGQGHNRTEIEFTVPNLAGCTTALAKFDPTKPLAEIVFAYCEGGSGVSFRQF